VRARRLALCTNAFSPLLRRIRAYIVPVYDYVLVTEPLSSAQRAAIGWRNRQGSAMAAISSTTTGSPATTASSGRYDAIYHFNNGLRAELDNRPASFIKLAGHFFATFPQLEGLRFSHAWGGAIDTCSRFCVFWGTAMGGRVAYAAGYTGLGVASTRFGAEVILDLLSGRPTERTALDSCGASPSPSRPNPCATPASRSPAGPSTAPTTTRHAQPLASHAGFGWAWATTLDVPT